MQTSDFYFDLPESLIAQRPLLNRSDSRLLVLNKESGDITHRAFCDVVSYINEGDCLVLNETKVIPARIYGRKETGAVIEVLLLKKIDLTHWEVLLKPAKRAKVGTRLVFSEDLSGIVSEILPDGVRVIDFSYEGIFEEILDSLGEMPLPPYIHEKLSERARYNTVYAKVDGSAAAPTAGLHFTEEILQQLVDKGVSIARITLHVGLGTFRPVKVTHLEEHVMHTEQYDVSEEAAYQINRTKANGGRVIAVGTTCTRTLESVTQQGKVVAGRGETDIFIYPGYEFKVIDAQLTNFHLPESTLVMLVSAFAGRENTLEAYREAVIKKYRFFSFGDAMFIL